MAGCYPPPVSGKPLVLPNIELAREVTPKQMVEISLTSSRHRPSIDLYTFIFNRSDPSLYSTSTMQTQDPRTSLVINPALFEDNPSITTKFHASLPLAIHNYTNRAFSRSNVDNLAIAARTLVTERGTGNVVSRSFSKFFNYHERHAYKPTGSEYAFSVEEKVDGSIISLFYYKRVWMMVSRSSFDSPHTTAARTILDKQYPKVLKSLDESKTYVFELVDPAMPIRVVYHKADLVLLTIISKDGQEPPHDFDWSSLPFTRPNIHRGSQAQPDLKGLSRLNNANEEGFVIKFWLTRNDRYPQRIKVKFESYLQAIGATSTAKNKASVVSPTTSSSPPSNSIILELYTKHRLKIHHFQETIVAEKMDRCKQDYLRFLEDIADDYGGEDWLEQIEQVWARIDALFTLQEDDCRRTVAILRREGHKPNQGQAVSKNARQSFDKRLKRYDVDPSFRASLLAWFSGESPAKQVALMMQSMEIPTDLRSTDILILV